MIDERGKLFGFVNIVDLAVILLIAMLAFGYLYRDRATPVSAEPKTVIVKVACPNVYPGVENNLNVGDQLVAAGGLTNVRVTEMEVADANWVTTNSAGEMVLATNPFRRDIFLTLEGQTNQITPSEITFAGQKVRAGKDDFFVKTQLVEIKATIISIEILD